MKIKRTIGAILGSVIVAIFMNACGLAVTMVSSKPPSPEAIVKDERSQVNFKPEEAKFLVGFSKKKIAPSGNFQWLAGYHPSRLGLFVNDDLWSRCLVIEDKNGNSLGIASLDLLGFLPNDVNDMRKEISGFFSGKVLVHTTHTHSAPDTMGLWGLTVWSIPLSTGRDEDYIRFVKKETTSCFREAIAEKQPAALYFGSGELRGLTKGPQDIAHDESLLTLHFLTKNRSIILFNWASHPDVIYSSYVTSDFLYYTYDFIERVTKSEAVFINGAIGAVQPKMGPPLKRWLRAKEIGVALGKAVLDVLKRERLSSKTDISWKTAEVRLGVDNKNFKKAAEFGLIPDMRDSDGRVLTEVNYVILGDAGIITFPGEVFPNIAMPLKDMLTDKYRFTFGLVNAELGYILFSKDFNSKKYPYHSKVSLGPNAGDDLYKALMELINSSQ